MASFQFDGGRVVVNQHETDDASILAFRVESCDAAFADAVAKGAKPLDAPEDKPYGVRAAYVHGPGGLLVEFEQALTR